MAILTPRNSPNPVSVPFAQTSASREAFGGDQARALEGNARALEGAANTASNIGLQILVDDNEREAKQKDSLFLQQKNALLYGEDGLYSKRGQNAVDSSQSTKEALHQLRQDVGSTVSNARIGQMFGEISQRRVDQELANIDKYTAGQKEQAAEDTTKARLSHATNEAILYWDDPSVVNTSFGTVVDEINSIGTRLGWSNEVIDNAIASEISNIHSATIQGALGDGDIASAEALMENSQEHILGTEQIKLANKINTAKRQRISDMERQESLADRRRKDIQEINHGAVVAAAARGELSENDLLNVLELGQIDTRQYQNTLSFLRGEVEEAGNGDDEADLEWRLNILNGEAIAPSFVDDTDSIPNGDIFSQILADERLSTRQKQELFALADQSVRRGPLLGRSDIQFYLNQIDDVIGNKNALGSFSDPADADRTSRAKQDFLDRVEAGENPTTVFNELNSDITGYRNTTESIRALPASKYWPGVGTPGSRSGTKAQLTVNYKIAMLAVGEAITNGEIDSGQAIQEFELLKQYQSMIERMAE